MDFDETDLGMQLKDKNLFRQQCFIDGKWTDSLSGETFDVYNPSDLSLVGRMPNCSKIETAMLLLPRQSVARSAYVN